MVAKVEMNYQKEDAADHSFEILKQHWKPISSPPLQRFREPLKKFEEKC